ncbi:serine/threonine protein kinase [Roseomonas sp. GCM10028921]
MARPRLTTGDRLDGFLIGERVHAGGMALLYSVTHPAHDLPMLMKVPRLFEGEDPAAIVSFEMEGIILPRLSGPHVPRFVAGAGFERQPYIVMERVAAPSLEGRMREAPWPVEEVALVGARIAAALDALHRQHVIHLDIKPGNILLREDGTAVLVDFGLSRHDQLPDLMEEEFRLPYGSAPYMAPEQVMGVRSDPRSDLFALGALMYHMATGALPFGSPARMKGLKRRLWRDPVPPRRLRPEVPPALQEVILRCLEVEPERRHPTAAQLILDLRNPEGVALTQRAGKLRRDGFGAVLRRRFNPEAQPRFRRPVAQGIAAAPILAVAVALSREGGEEGAGLSEELRRAVVRMLPTLPGARLACLNVLRLNRIQLDTTLDAEGRSKHARRLAELRHWAAPLGLPEGRVTFHVLEAVDPAEALLEFVTVNPVDHVVLGARGSSALRQHVGSVSAAVSARAPCTVTVVRPRTRED